MTSPADRLVPLAGTDRDENTPAIAGKAGLLADKAGKVMASDEKGGNQHDDEF